MHSPIVFPDTVIQSVLRSPISASSFITAYTPPASLRSSIYVGPAGARWQRLGVFSLIGLANLISKSKPISCAIAGRCNILFVEQPSAISTVSAFIIESFVIISLAVIPLLTISITAIPACLASLILSEYTAGIVPFPRSPIPRASVRQFIELAVYIPEQEPQVGHTFSSNSRTSSSVIVPAAYEPTASNIDERLLFLPFT